MERREFLKKAGLGAAAYLTMEATQGLDRALDLFMNSDLEQRLQEKYKIRIIGRATKGNLKELESALSTTESGLDNFQPQMTNVKSIDLKPLGLFCAFADARINEKMHTMLLNSIDPFTIVHELADFWLRNLLYKEQFEVEWGNAAKFDYSTKLAIDEYRWKELNARSKINGFVCPYGSNSLDEDVHTWAEDVFLQKFLEAPPKSQVGADKRYLKKLELLAEYAFISPEEFRRVRPIYTPG